MSPLTSEHRRSLAYLTDKAEAELASRWGNFNDPRQAKDWLLDFLPGLIDKYGPAASTLAADYYDDLRDTLAVRGAFRAVTGDLPKIGQIDALAGFAVGPLFGATPDAAAVLSLALGGVQRLIANTSRATITTSAVEDRHAEGWQRVGAGGCDFCLMLLGRGAVYTEATADFAAHDRCRCSAEPVFGP